MSDLVNGSALATPSNGQVSQASSNELGASTEQASNNGQPVQDENIRKLQSTYDKKIAEQQRTFQQQQQAQAQQLQALQNELRNMRYAAAPDDYTRKELEVEELRKERDAYANAYQQMTRAQQDEQDRKEAIHQLTEAFDGLTPKELDEALKEAGATTYKDAVKVAANLQREKEKRKQTTDDDKRERNQVDYGGGAPRTVSGRWEEDYAAARERRDSVAMMRLLNEKKG